MMTGGDARRVELVPLDELRPAVRNAKAHADAEIAASIGRFGVIDLPVLDERTGHLVAGHGRLDALRAAHEAGESPPEGVEARDGDWLVPVVRGWASRSDADAEAAGVALNRLTELGGWERGLLGEILGDYRQDADWFLGTGYGPEDVEALLGARQEPAGEQQPAPPDPPGLERHHAVLVDHLTETAQQELLERLRREGYKCRAMTS